MPYVEYDEVEAVCRDCGRAFRSEDALDEHRAEAHASAVNAPSEPVHPKTVKCSLCRQRFTTTAALQEHTRRAHSS
jgi:C2H2 type zinc finger protein